MKRALAAILILLSLSVPTFAQKVRVGKGKGSQLVITTTSLVGAQQGVAYSATVHAKGGDYSLYLGD